MHNSKPSTENIWRELSGRLRQFVLARVRIPSDADDIIQQVFLKIHLKLDSLRTTDRLESWVFQITRNVINDHYRSKSKETSLLTETADDKPGMITDQEEKGSTNLNKYIAGCVRSLISQLPEDQRRAVEMYELHGVSQQEIADVESVSLSGAKSRIQRGRKALVGLLDACCKFEFDRRGNIIDAQVKNDCNAKDGGSCGC